MQGIDKALFVAAAAAAFLLVTVIIATAGERDKRDTLEDTVRHQQQFWAEWRERSDARVLEDLARQELDVLHQIEENTR
jgi:hypothetical protein